MISPLLRKTGGHPKVRLGQKRSASGASGPSAKSQAVDELRGSLPSQCANNIVWCVLNPQQETDTATVPIQQDGHLPEDTQLLTALASLKDPLLATTEHPDGDSFRLDGEEALADKLAASQASGEGCSLPNMLVVFAEVTRGELVLGDLVVPIAAGKVKVTTAAQWWQALDAACSSGLITAALDWQTAAGYRLLPDQLPRVVLLPSPHSAPNSWQAGKVQDLLQRLKASRVCCIPSIEEYVQLADKVGNLQQLCSHLAVTQHHQNGPNIGGAKKNEIPSIVPTAVFAARAGDAGAAKDTLASTTRRLYQELSQLQQSVAGDEFWSHPEACEPGRWIIKPAFGSRCQDLFTVKIGPNALGKAEAPPTFAGSNGIAAVLEAIQERPGCDWLVQPYVPALAATEYRVVSLGSVDSNAIEYVVATARGTTADGSIASQRFEGPQDWLVLGGKRRGRVEFENQRNGSLQKRLLSAAAAVQHALLAGQKRVFESVRYTMSRLDFAYIDIYDNTTNGNRFVINEVDNTLNAADLLIDMWEAATERAHLATCICQAILWAYAESKDVRDASRSLYIRK